jgi:hypothetical protein
MVTLTMPEKGANISVSNGNTVTLHGKKIGTVTGNVFNNRRDAENAAKKNEMIFPVPDSYCVYVVKPEPKCEKYFEKPSPVKDSPFSVERLFPPDKMI